MVFYFVDSGRVTLPQMPHPSEIKMKSSNFNFLGEQINPSFRHESIIRAEDQGKDIGVSGEFEPNNFGFGICLKSWEITYWVKVYDVHFELEIKPASPDQIRTLHKEGNTYLKSINY